MDERAGDGHGCRGSRQAWGSSTWRWVGGPVSTLLLGLVIAVTGGSQSHYQDVLLAVPIVTALTPAPRHVIGNIGFAVLVAGAPQLYEPGLDPMFATDTLADALFWVAVTAVVARQSQRLRAQRAQLREIDELRSSFLRATSHELHTPLTVVRGVAATLSRRDRELDPGQLDVELSPAVVIGDAAKLERVAENLLSNAAKHGGAAVALRVTVAADEEAGEAVCTVEDDGPGLEPAVRASLFDPFVQGRGSRTAPVRAPGSGSPSSAPSSTCHDGELRADDRPGGGARFTVTLPLVAPDADGVSRSSDLGRRAPRDRCGRPRC
jgi:signal transduction histidine kinase